MFTIPRMHPATRGQLLLAAIPLATLVITRALAQIEELIEQRTAALVGLDAQIKAREAALGVLVKYAGTEDTAAPAPAGPAAGMIDAMARARAAANYGPAPTVPAEPAGPPIPLELPECHECQQPAALRSGSGVPYCTAHAPWLLEPEAAG